MTLAKRIIAALVVMLFVSTNLFSQKQDVLKEVKIQTLISQLHTRPWAGAENYCSPMCWDFQFTLPMQKILEIGSAAQNVLIENLDDVNIKDQVIILLGGVGDEHAVAPLIKAMIAKDAIKNTPNAKQINLSANLALTNITVSEVIWHHGGGTEFRRCPDNPKECWQEWWEKNKSTFTVKGITQSRGYMNYPNYGIYKRK
jgi:hypothetical protein